MDSKTVTSFDEIMTLSEAATYLKLAERTIHRMIQRSEIPCARVGGQWRFVKSVLDDWLISRMQVLPRNELDPFLQATDGMVQLSRMIDRDHVVDRVNPGSPEEVIKQIVSNLAEQGVVRHAQSLVASLLAREQLSSTAMGHGVAVPHLRRPGEFDAGLPAVALAICREGTPFSAPDTIPVHFFFLLGTTSEVVHLRLLKRITMLFRDDSLSGELLTCNTASDMIDLLARREAAIFGGGSSGN
jgi:PTS system nitrogen regulatory IIA component